MTKSFVRSQKAHRLLNNKYDNYKSRKPRKLCDKLSRYHWNCYVLQKEYGRILTISERKRLYKEA